MISVSKLKLNFNLWFLFATIDQLKADQTFARKYSATLSTSSSATALTFFPIHFSFFIAYFFVPLAINTASIPDSISRSISFYEPIFFLFIPYSFFFFVDAHQHTHIEKKRYDYKTLYNVPYYWWFHFTGRMEWYLKIVTLKMLKLCIYSFMNLISFLQTRHHVSEIKNRQSHSLCEANQRSRRRRASTINNV